MKKFSKYVLALTVGCSMLLPSGLATASDFHQARCDYKPVIVYKTVVKPCVQYVVKVDECGDRYLVKIVTYKTIQVPFEKQVKICF